MHAKVLQVKFIDTLEAVITQFGLDLDENKILEVMASLEALRPYPPTYKPKFELLEP